MFLCWGMMGAMNSVSDLLSGFARRRVEIFHVGHDVERARVLREIRLSRRRSHVYFDADLRLINSAEVLGFPAERCCPVCGKDSLRIIRWIYGVELGEKSGTARSVGEIRLVIDDFVRRFVDFPQDFSQGVSREMSIHTVEVCSLCKWNYLLREDTLRA